MWPDRVSNQGPLTDESDALLTALGGSANVLVHPAYLSDNEARISIPSLVKVQPFIRSLNKKKYGRTKSDHN